MEGYILYLCSIASNVQTLFMIIGVLGTIGLLIYQLIVRLDSAFMDTKKASLWYNVLFFIFLCIGIAIPSSKDCYIIFGVTKTVEYLQSSEEIKTLPNNAIKALNYYVEDIVKDKE